MDDHDDFNSSDIEMPEQRPNPHTQLGRASIEAMLDDAFENRVTSKIASKQLGFALGAPGTRTDRSRWANRFSSFCTGVLQHKPGTVPTGQDIERFLFTIVEHLQGRVSKINPEISAPSFSMVQSGLRRLIGSLQFDFESFYLNKHQTLRIASVMETLVQDGKLTKDHKRESLWLGAFVVHRISIAIFEDALHKGTLSWDMVLSKALSVVLTGALITRAGDIGRNAAYKGLECLLYEHITLKVVTIDGADSFQGLFAIFNEKGKKQKRKEARKPTLNALMDPKYNAVCPIALLLIMAMRLGVVADTTVEAVLERARGRKDKTVVWIKPKNPVLCAFDIHTHQLIETKPASGTQLTRNAKQGAELAGIMEDVILHDIRRGGFRDLANLKNAIGGRLEGVAEAAGHSASTRTKGITKQYTGHLKEDNWKTRLEENSGNEEFGVTFLEQPFKKRRLDSETVTKYCKENDLDSEKKGDRVKAWKGLKEQAKQSWIGKGLGDEPVRMDAVDSLGEDSAELRSSLSLDPRLFEINIVDQEDSEIGEVAQMQTIDLLISGSGMKDTEEFVLNNDEAESDIAQLIAKPYDFINTLSKINVVRTLKSLDKTGFLITGGSRDEPSRFKFPCPNKVFGCTVTCFNEQALAGHVDICEIDSHEKHQEFLKEQDSKKFICDHPGCESRFLTKGHLSNHKNKCHGKVWVPMKCDFEGCPGGDKIYNSQSTRNAHRRSALGNYVSQTCQYPGCTTKTLYAYKPSLLAHLRTVHKLSGEAAKVHILLKDSSKKEENADRDSC